MLHQGAAKADPEDGFVRPVRLLLRQAEGELRKRVEEGARFLRVIPALRRQNPAQFAQQHLAPLHERSVAVEGDDLRGGVQAEHGCFYNG
jgi:hypothetical protein